MRVKSKKRKRGSGRGKGKSLGSTFERKIARRFSKWIVGSCGEDVLWRSAGSGSVATIRNDPIRSRNYAGDLMAIDQRAYAFSRMFYVEIKRYKDIKVNSFVFKRSGFLVDVWNDTLERARYFRKIPIVVVNQPQYPTLVLMNRLGRDRLGVPGLIGKSAFPCLYSTDLKLFLFDLELLLDNTEPYL